jgi:hypothetical protein
VARVLQAAICRVPGNSRARVTSVKNLDDVHYLLKSLRGDDLKKEDVLSNLRGIDRELKRLLVANDSPDEKAEMLRELQAFSDELRQMV